MLLLVTSLVILMTTRMTSAGSHKKGISVSSWNYHCDDLDTFSNIAWWWDWHQLPHEHQDANCTNQMNVKNRVPTVWGWRHNKDYPLEFTNETSGYVMTFNEPNHLHQSNLSPQEAAVAYREIQARANRQNQLLVAPSATKCTSGSERCPMPGVQWLTEFLHACHGCQVDFLATHSYSCSISHVLDWLEELHNKFHKKIWLTEVACPTHSHSQALHFMQNLLPKLENLDYVYRYSWFTSRVKTTATTATHEDSLLHTASSTFTTLGQWYQDFM